jgi:hypothetical protein
MQAVARGFNARLNARKLLLEASAAQSIQRYLRGSLSRKQYIASRESAILIQTIIRRANARVRFNAILASSFEKSDAKRRKAASTKHSEKSSDGDTNPPTSRISAEKVFPRIEGNSRPKRKPFGDVKGSATISSSRKVVANTSDEEGSAKISSSRKVVANTSDEENTTNTKGEYDTETRRRIEKMKVVELKEALMGYGIETKALRNVRKAELVEMCLSKRMDPQSA